MQTPKHEEFLWDVAADLALERFYIRRDGKIAQKPAFLLFYKFLGGKWTLTMREIAFWRFRSKAKAYDKLREIASKATVPIEIVLKKPRGYRIIAKKET